MKELYKPIIGYENYSISNLGNIKHKDKNKIASNGIHGYLRVCLWKNNKGNKFSVHRLVAQAFIPNPDNKPQVNHKDGNKTNNHVDNLEWVTASENIRHAIDNDLSSIKFGSKNLASKLTEENVLFIRNNAKIKYSVKDLSKMFNVSTTNIYNIINNKKWIKI